jgi:hypothetical protein
MGGLASLFGVAVSLAIGGVLSAVVGAGALVWMRRHGLDRGVLRAPEAVPSSPIPAAPPVMSGSLPGRARPR